MDAATAALLESPELAGMILAAAHRAGIFYGVGYLDRDDVLAELTEQAVIAATDYNPAVGKFTTHLWLRLLGHAVDLRRRHGRMARNGLPRPTEVPFPEEQRSIGLRRRRLGARDARRPGPGHRSLARHRAGRRS